MLRSVLRLLAVTVVLVHVAVACDGGDLNPQPLPPVDNSGKGTGNAPTTGSESGDNSAASGGSDSGTAPPSDGGDAGDGGDGGK